MKSISTKLFIFTSIVLSSILAQAVEVSLVGQSLVCRVTLVGNTGSTAQKTVPIGPGYRLLGSTFNSFEVKSGDNTSFTVESTLGFDKEKTGQAYNFRLQMTTRSKDGLETFTDKSIVLKDVEEKLIKLNPAATEDELNKLAEEKIKAYLANELYVKNNKRLYTFSCAVEDKK